MGIRADLEVAAVLALVHVGVHVAHDREADLADGVRELRDGPDADHLVDRRGERDGGTGHPRDARAPHAAGDDHDLRLDVALVRPDARDPAVDDIEAGHLGRGEIVSAPISTARSRMIVPARSESTTPTAGCREAAEDDRFVDERDQRLDAGRVEQLGLDPPRARRGHPTGQLLHALGRAGDLDPTALGEDAELLVLPDAVQGQGRHLARVVGREDEVGGVPGRAAGVRQRPLVEQDDLAVAEPREVVDEAVADDAGPDDDDARGSR